MIDYLIEKIKKTGAPIVVGLDPTMKFVPEHIKKAAFAEKGETLEGAAEAIWLFNKEIIDKTYDLIPAVKPQIAMYEQFGIAGLIAFKKTIDYCKEKGLVVIGDIKRGDIGSTSEAYAAAHLGKVQIGNNYYAGFDEDFATVNPYLGSDGVQPFINVCKAEKKGIFVLVKTSNPSSGELQDRLMKSGTTAGAEQGNNGTGNISFADRPLYEIVGEQVAAWGEQLMGKYGYSSVGAVVGATYPEQGAVLRKLMPKTFILVPGYGAQGGTGKDLVYFFDDNRLGAIVNSSRGIIAAYQNEKYKKFGADNFADASRQAVIDMITDIDQAFISVGK
ncbi:MAG: orotidine-5'-phosphate decarboxylase [Lachnospiraceae bacterium]|jgi:orotidine-5'-phosphate decarboxylase|nr:orotidine-5'-phosphate decarboxylase [Lachnospiraceae bacterium]MCI9399057.1 orotidine-5'-phosphate decarboxylase [Lachnospiraceae bacterium]MCX4377205.1 orotidine-5'-phosphate decarboxylase [Lachnospiraceae bacterium]